MKVANLGFLLISAYSLTACMPASMSFHQPSDGSNNSLNSTQPPVVCQIGGPTGGSKNGIVGKLYYLDDKSAPLNHVVDYINSGHLSPASFYFSTLFVPTEYFNVGFQYTNGKYLSTPTGNKLIENFALDMQSVITLAPGDLVGDYQFGVLADDGATIEALNSSSKYEMLVDDDGQHPTRMGCGTKIVHFDASTKLSVRIRYYQGPRDEIALIPLWRKVDASKALDTTYCGDTGNEVFFDPATSTAKPEYNSLLGRGWVPLKPLNYNLPNGLTNPCI